MYIKQLAYAVAGNPIGAARHQLTQLGLDDGLSRRARLYTTVNHTYRLLINQER